MDLAPTLVLLAAALGGAVFSGWRGARPFDPVKGPRMIPWRLLMVTLAVGAIVLLVHVATLLGWKAR